VEADICLSSLILFQKRSTVFYTFSIRIRNIPSIITLFILFLNQKKQVYHIFAEGIGAEREASNILFPGLNLMVITDLLSIQKTIPIRFISLRKEFFEMF